MKILIASSHGVYDDGYLDTQKSNTGFNHMIRAVSKMLANQGDEVDVFAQSVLSGGHDLGNVKLCRHTLRDVLLSSNSECFITAHKINRHGGFKLKEKLKNYYYSASGHYCQRLIWNNGYDVVHIHGLTNATLPLMIACIRSNTPFTVTLHGLNSFDNNTRANHFSKIMERRFIMLLKEHSLLSCSVVSSGIKKRMIEFAGSENMDNIVVIANPVIQINCSTHTGNKEFYNSFLCIGNISIRKNQALVLEAYLSLPLDVQNRYPLVFIGGNERELEAEVNMKGNKNVYFTGSIPQKNVMSYIENAKAIITASVSEGFGLPIVEGYRYGIPSIFPKWIDAYGDLFDDNCSVAVTENSADAFRKAILTCIEKSWSKKLIKEKAHKYTEERIGEQYHSFLYNVASIHRSPISYQDLMLLLV